MKRLKVAALLLGFTIILMGCKKETVAETEKVRETEQDTKTETESETESETEIGLTMETENTEGMVRSYLTGKLIDESIARQRPIAVMLNNIVNAVPQAGIANADIVYEAPVEGSMTRLMGIFEDYQDLEKIGSVRSCRNYYVYYAREFDAIYLHYGQAVYALSLLADDEFHNLSGLDGIGPTVYYRTTDRVAPHNAYASAEGIAAGIETMGYRTDYIEDYTGHYNFADDNALVELEGEVATFVKPGYTVNRPWFEYDEETKLYFRFQYGEEQIDELTDEQLSYTNIIFQYSQWENFDQNGYLNIDTISGGSGKYITGGVAIDITWNKESEYGVTRYYNSAGEEITLNQGKTWVCIILDTNVDNIEITEK